MKINFVFISAILMVNCSTAIAGKLTSMEGNDSEKAVSLFEWVGSGSDPMFTSLASAGLNIQAPKTTGQNHLLIRSQNRNQTIQVFNRIQNEWIGLGPLTSFLSSDQKLKPSSFKTAAQNAATCEKVAEVKFQTEKGTPKTDVYINGGLEGHVDDFGFFKINFGYQCQSATVKVIGTKKKCSQFEDSFVIQQNPSIYTRPISLSCKSK